MQFVLSTLAAVFLFVLACSGIGATATQEPTLSIRRMAEQSGIGAPVPVDDYVPVHPEDRYGRVCYRVSNSANADLQCLVEDNEHGPATSYNGFCSGDSELPDGYAWCDYSYLKDEFELRYGDKEAFLPSMIRFAQQSGLDAPQPIDVGHPDAWCFRMQPGEDPQIRCWFERIDRKYYGIGCGRGYAGSFWCIYGEERHYVDTPVPGPTWTWAWTDPRD